MTAERDRQEHIALIGSPSAGVASRRSEPDARALRHRVSGVCATMNEHLSEGDQAPVDLTPYWKDTIERHKLFTASRPQHRCVRWLMEHILDAGYSKGLFPGTSAYGLLISVPLEGKVNYKHTLHVGYDELAHVVNLNMKIWPTEQRSPEDSKSATKWSTTCQPSELIDSFEHFLNEPRIQLINAIG